MAENSKIEWCDSTANLWWGCVEVSPGCDNCYAKTLAKRWGFDVWGNDAPRREIVGVFKDIVRFQRKAEEAGETHRVFVGSMMDIFEKPMPLTKHADGTPTFTFENGEPIKTDVLRDFLFYEVIPKCPNLLFLLLTKRPSNIAKMVPRKWLTDPPQNVMYGTSPCNQATANTIIPQLLSVPGKHFLSCEPLIGGINLRGLIARDLEINRTDGEIDVLKSRIDWVIVGGESGRTARPMEEEWIRSISNQCATADIPFFFKQAGTVLAKQWNATDNKGGDINEFPDEFKIRQFP